MKTDGITQSAILWNNGALIEQYEIGMLKKIVVEVPVSWFDNPVDGEKNRAFFANFLIQLSKFNVPLHLIKVPFGADSAARKPEKGALVFSYHSFGKEKNVWHLKEAPVTPLFSIDRYGYSGWAEIADQPRAWQDISDVSDEHAEQVIEKYRQQFKEKRISKYPQPDEQNVDLPAEYIFFPLQVSNDPVSQFSPFNMLDMLKRAAEAARRTGITLLVKRHPFCSSVAVEKTLQQLAEDNPQVRVVNLNVHTLIEHARAVMTVNSGVGIEALIDGAAVYASGKSEWFEAANAITSLEDIDAIFSQAPRHMDSWQKKLIAFLLDSYWVAPADYAAIERKIEQSIAQFDPDYGIDSALSDVSEIFLPIVLDLQGRLEYESRRAKLAIFDFEGLNGNIERLDGMRAEQAAQIAQLRHESEQRIADLEAQVQQKQQEIEQKDSELEQKENEIARMKAGLEQHQAQLISLANDLSNARMESERLHSALNLKDEQMEARMRELRESLTSGKKRKWF
ncbi:capsular polysaccharide biosynthesis protein [Enterobacillus tribolii]|uniref:Capsular polysaccharide biosynthesis protein n=2 Tax=Enterobacillus tribolii TaxID=1487935 RepID=A0A370Q866_9GAMM|nr:capsular polysaccharide biosynthesis protein [Enterobacillus tribolii]